MNWKEAYNVPSKEYKCGFCEREIASELGFTAIGTVSANKHGRHESYEGIKGSIYICYNCKNPTYFDEDNEQYPDTSFGNLIKHIKEKQVEDLYQEARRCMSSHSYTSTVMCCRKLLMNISVSEGAKEGLNFVDYVNYLKDKNYIPPNGLKWVDEIRKHGNTANHKIVLKTKGEAFKILLFTEMLLKFIYELPNMIND
ncbi:DUF4145 domain-containing protein [uncultured Tenacibaculum sp.]|uniref:DUF4145 domain-containing protein n=1 Tax=uncultured Tenacibaculum sp. TaxID=174713 RepID=UPI002639C644|nr:DUF4145 domain-containing protein [uncultured Tenacibaculum sp.]